MFPFMLRVLSVLVFVVMSLGRPQQKVAIALPVVLLCKLLINHNNDNNNNPEF